MYAKATMLALSLSFSLFAGSAHALFVVEGVSVELAHPRESGGSCKLEMHHKECRSQRWANHISVGKLNAYLAQTPAAKEATFLVYDYLGDEYPGRQKKFTVKYKLDKGNVKTVAVTELKGKDWKKTSITLK